MHARAHLVDRGRLDQHLPVAEDRHQQVLPLLGRRDAPAAHRVDRVDHPALGRGPQQLVVDHVGHELAVVAEAPHLLDARGGDLGGLLGELDHVAPGAARVAHRAQLVDAAQGPGPVAGHEARAHAPHADGRALLLEALDGLLVEVVAGEDAAALEAGLVEHLAGLEAQVGQVARVQPDAQQVVAQLAQEAPGLDGVAHAVERVVGVDQQHAVVGQGPGEGLEGRRLALERHHPRVGVGAAHGDAEQLPGQHVRGGRAAPHVGRPGGRQRAVEALGPPQPELQDGLVAGGDGQPRGLGGDQALEVDHVDQGRLEDLALQDRPAHAHQRLVGEDHRPLGDGRHLAGQAQPAQVVEEGPLEQRAPVGTGQRGQVVEVVGLEAEAPQVLDQARDAAGHREAAAVGLGAEGEVEDGLAPGRAPPVAVGHGELVEVGQERQRGLVDAVEEGVGGAHSAPLRRASSRPAHSFMSTSLPWPSCPATQASSRSSGTSATTMSSCSSPPPSPTRRRPCAA